MSKAILMAGALLCVSIPTQAKVIYDNDGRTISQAASAKSKAVKSRVAQVRGKVGRRHVNLAVPARYAAATIAPRSSLVEAARARIGTGAIYGRTRLWCARFMNYVLERTGHRGTGSDLALSFLRKPRTHARVGAIAVMHRRGGGHVGVVSGFDTKGNPIVISGNHKRRVAESVYPASRILAYVSP